MGHKIKYHKYIDSYINAINNGDLVVNDYIKKQVKIVEEKLNAPGISIDSKRIDHMVEAMESHFDIKMFDWELYVCALIHCYEQDGLIPVFTTFFLYMGRGAGKNKFFAMLAWYFTTPLHGIKGYNIDIVANTELQAKTSFEDVRDILESDREQYKKLGYKWNKEEIKNTLTMSTFQYHTSNPNSKDGFRPGAIMFDEIHAYQTTDMIKVFTSGLGKVKHGRTFFITTNGNVRGGALDKELEKAKDILDGKRKSIRYLPLLYECENDKEIHNPIMWQKANPSLKYLPILQAEMEEQYEDSIHDEDIYAEFMTKRLNRPKESSGSPVAKWDDIKACTREELPLELLKGKQCIGGLDFAEIDDFCSCGLLFKIDGIKYWLEHTFVNKEVLKPEARKIKFPIREMEAKGLITIIDSPTIRPDHISSWFKEQMELYSIQCIYVDTYRSIHIGEEFERLGIPFDTVRTGAITHSKIAPSIDTLFKEHELIWGDNPTMNWYTNNTFKKKDLKGNIEYLKIEPKTRKTDGFHALLHAMTHEHTLQDYNSSYKNNIIDNLGVYTY